jgi:hypothetical protein
MVAAAELRVRIDNGAARCEPSWRVRLQRSSGALAALVGERSGRSDELGCRD